MPFHPVQAAMHPKNRAELAHRVARAAGAALSDHGYVSSVDVLVGMGWLDPKLLEDWRRGRVDFLERVVHANLSRISKAMKLFRSWAADRGLQARETAYVRWTKGHRPPLRFSKSGNPHIERSYRTHWVSPKLAAQPAALAKKPKRRRNEPGQAANTIAEASDVETRPYWDDPDVPWLHPPAPTSAPVESTRGRDGFFAKPRDDGIPALYDDEGEIPF